MTASRSNAEKLRKLYEAFDFGGAEAVVYGPGDFSVAHLPSEHIDAGEVLQCAEVFKRLAREAAGW